MKPTASVTGCCIVMPEVFRAIIEAYTPSQKCIRVMVIIPTGVYDTFFYNKMDK